MGVCTPLTHIVHIHHTTFKYDLLNSTQILHDKQQKEYIQASLRITSLYIFINYRFLPGFLSLLVSVSSSNPIHYYNTHHKTYTSPFHECSHILLYTYLELHSLYEHERHSNVMQIYASKIHASPSPSIRMSTLPH